MSRPGARPPARKKPRPPAPAPMPQPVEDWLESMRREYRQRFPEKLARLKTRLEDLAKADSAGEAFAALLLDVHRMHGSAGTYGMHDAGRILEAWEALLHESKVPHEPFPPQALIAQRKLLRKLEQVTAQTGLFPTLSGERSDGTPRVFAGYRILGIAAGVQCCGEGTT